MRAVLAASKHETAPDGTRTITIDNKRLAQMAGASHAAARDEL